jgi:hypothetical protein
VWVLGTGAVVGGCLSEVGGLGFDDRGWLGIGDRKEVNSKTVKVKERR